MGSEDGDLIATLDERGGGAAPAHEPEPAPEPAAAGPAPLANGANPDRYRPGDEIGRGGMGRVVEATDTVLGRIVAVKEIRDRDDELVRRFEREVYVTARLEHPAIVPVYDAGRTAEGLPFYVMRRVTGRPLDVVIGEASGLDGRLALIPNLLAAVDAIAHAHRRGVIHRDLKPANVLVGDHGETLVIDWGLAKVIEAEPEAVPVPDQGADRARARARARDLARDLETRHGTVIGTPGFMPPEQALGEDVDPRGDVYALGASLYQLLVGAPPWSGTGPTEILDKVVAGRPPALAALVPGVPRDLAAIADKAMAPDRDDRYPDAGALGDDLRRFLRGQLVAAHRYSPRLRFTRWLRRNRTAVVVGAAAGIALIALAALSLVRILADRDRIAARERDAIAARDDAQAQADGLLIETARAVVDRDPTYAIGRLAELRPESPRWPAARAVVAAARARGIAIAFPGHGEAPWSMEMAPDGHRVATVTRGDIVFVHDLVRRTTTTVTAPRRGTVVAWLGDRLAMQGDDGVTLVDVATAARTVIPAPDPVELLTGAPDGAALGYITAAGRGFLLTDGGDPIEIPPDAAPLESVRVASGGTRVMVRGATLRVLARDGATWHELLALPTTNTVAWSDDGTRLAIRDGTRLDEWTLADPPAITRTWTVAVGTSVFYAGATLMVHDLRAARIFDYGSRPLPQLLVTGVATLPLAAAAFADGELAVAEGNELRLTTALRTIRIPMPEHGHRLVTRPGSPFVAVGTAAHVLVWDLREVWPERVVPQIALEIRPVSRTTLMAFGIDQVRLFDADGSHRDLDPLGPTKFRADVASGFLLQVEDDGGIDVLVTATGQRHHVIVPGALTAAGYGGDSVIATTGHDLVVAALAGGAPRTLAHVEPVVDWLEVDRGFVAALGPDHVWRSDGRTEQLAAVADASGARWDVDGTLYLASGPDLLRWAPGAPAPVAFARIDAIPVALEAIRDRTLAVIGQDSAIYQVDLDSGRVRQALGASETSPGLAVDGTVGCVVADDKRVEIADLVTGERWSLPTETAELTRAVPAPDGRSIYAMGSFNHVVRFAIDLPRDPTVLKAWLRDRSNGRAGAAGLVEWQLPTPTAVR